MSTAGGRCTVIAGVTLVFC